MSIYIHESLQYQLRKDLRIGRDSESINSLFIEIDKLTIGTKYNVIIGCIYRPHWVNLCDFHDLLNDTLQSCHANNKYFFILCDFNVDLSLNIKTSTATEDFKNLFSMHHFVPLINKPTREMKNSKTVIDNIFFVMYLCCCSPSESCGRKWGDSNFHILTELPVPPLAAGVVGTF